MEKKWREIVSSCRFEGPAATITRNESGELVIEAKPSSYQICLISEDFADNFRETLHSVMFLDMC